MEYQDYPNSGKLMKTQEKRHDKSPDMWGEIKFDPEYLKDAISKADGLVTVKLSGWKQTSKAGNNYVSLRVNTLDQQSAKPASNGKDPWDE